MSSDGSEQPLLDPVGLGDSDDVDLTFANILLESARKDHSLLGDVVSAAAVPRKFDASLLAALVGAEKSQPDFVRAFEELIAMPFVSRRRDRRFRLHGDVRDSLLAQLKSTEAGRERLTTLDNRVADYYQAEHEQARILAVQFASVDELLREVSPGRVQIIRAACEDRLIRPLIESLHHRTRVDASGSGLQQFRTNFELYEQEDRLSICQLLLSAWRTDVDRLAGSEQVEINQLRSWASYYEGRLALAESDYERVQTIGKELLADPGLVPQLRLWSLWLISDVLRTNGQYREALTAIENELAERGEEDADAWNRPLIYARQASVHESLWDYDSQILSLNLALESARDVGNVAVQGDVLSQLSRALVGQGDLVGAADHAIQALHIARTIDPPNLELARACAVQIMQSFGSADPRVADTFHAEARALTRGDDTTRIVEVDTAYAAVLSSSARFEHAHRTLDELSGLLSDLRPIDRISVQLTHANLLDAEGREREAVQENRHTVEALGNSRRDRWPLAAAITNAATTEMDLGDMLDEAERSAATARDLWTQLGDERGVILGDVVQAEVLRRRGKYEAARVLLGDDSRLPGPHPPVEWLLVNAELELDVGRLDVAAKHLNAAVEESLRSGNRGSAASAASRLLGVQLRAGDLAGADQAADRVYELMAELRTLWSYRSTAETELADQHNGRAVRQLIVSSLRPIPAVRDAVQHLEEAIERDVGSCWYSLNLAYAHGKLGDKKSTKKALDAAIGKAEGSLFGDPIAQLAAEFPM